MTGQSKKANLVPISYSGYVVFDAVGSLICMNASVANFLTVAEVNFPSDRRGLEIPNSFRRNLGRKVP